MKQEWIDALERLTYGIYVLTSADGDTINGMVASWVSQVSYTPLLLMVAVHPSRYTHRLIDRSGAFALHCLSREQKHWLGRFKGPDPVAKFADIVWEPGITGSPLISGCPAVFECRVRERHAPGNHTLFIGEVVDARTAGLGEVLSTLDYEGTYLGKS